MYPHLNQFSRLYRALSLLSLLSFSYCIHRSNLSDPPPITSQNPQHLEQHTFAVVGDYGLHGPDEERVAQLIEWMEPAYIITLGDNSYPNGDPNLLDENIGFYFHKYIRFHSNWRGAYVAANNDLKEQRFFPAAGNHDWYQGSLEAFKGYFALPGNQTTYRHRHGPIEFFTLSTDPAEPLGIDQSSQQARWLQENLESSDASWKIIAMHHSPYATADHGSHPILQWPYQAWGSDLVMSGHDHAYERILINNLHYIVCGTGGAPLDAFEHPTFSQASTHIRQNQVFGAIKGQVSKEQLTLQYYNTDRVLFDEVVLRR